MTVTDLYTCRRGHTVPSVRRGDGFRHCLICQAQATRAYRAGLTVAEWRARQGIVPRSRPVGRPPKEKSPMCITCYDTGLVGNFLPCPDCEEE